MTQFSDQNGSTYNEVSYLWAQNDSKIIQIIENDTNLVIKMGQLTTMCNIFWAHNASKIIQIIENDTNSVIKMGYT